MIGMALCGLASLMTGLVGGYLVGWSIGLGEGFEEAELWTWTGGADAQARGPIYGQPT
jgi:hypothetical protein